MDVIQYLCALPPERGVDPAFKNNDALAAAAAMGQAKVIEALASLPPERGVTVPALDCEAVVLAAKAGHIVPVRLLYEMYVDRCPRERLVPIPPAVILQAVEGYRTRMVRYFLRQLPGADWFLDEVLDGWDAAIERGPDGDWRKRMLRLRGWLHRRARRERRWRHNRPLLLLRAMVTQRRASAVALSPQLPWRDTAAVGTQPV